MATIVRISCSNSDGSAKGFKSTADSAGLEAFRVFGIDITGAAGAAGVAGAIGVAGAARGTGGLVRGKSPGVDGAAAVDAVLTTPEGQIVAKDPPPMGLAEDDRLPWTLVGRALAGLALAGLALAGRALAGLALAGLALDHNLPWTLGGPARADALPWTLLRDLSNLEKNAF